MKLVMLFVIGVLGGGCATSAQHLSTSGASAYGGASGSLADIKQKCVMERSLQIYREWSRYEFKRNVQVVFPNWRENARVWARHECSYGRPIASFHPAHMRRR